MCIHHVVFPHRPSLQRGCWRVAIASPCTIISEIPCKININSSLRNLTKVAELGHDNDNHSMV
jgi:hypothetical protein